MPPFDAAYAGWPIWPSNAAIDAVLMMTPRSPLGSGVFCAMAAAASRITLKVPTRLTRIGLLEQIERMRAVFSQHLRGRPDARGIDDAVQAAKGSGTQDRPPR